MTTRIYTGDLMKLFATHGYAHVCQVMRARRAAAEAEDASRSKAPAPPMTAEQMKDDEHELYRRVLARNQAALERLRGQRAHHGSGRQRLADADHHQRGGGDAFSSRAAAAPEAPEAESSERFLWDDARSDS